MEILTIENLSFFYPDAEKPAVSEVSLSVESGEFLVLCGASGCGKSTLLRLIKRETAPFGRKNGRILFCGRPEENVTVREAAEEIGLLLQNPEAQIVTDKVWHELSFGLENLGLPPDEIRARIAETANYFGIDTWFRSPTDALSGGQKQILSLAAVIAMRPRLLLLDEPTSQLDPIAASEFFHILKKLNRELGITVILAEHRLEEVFAIADRVAVMENGSIVTAAAPRDVCRECGHVSVAAGFPTPARVFHALGGEGTYPLTVNEGRQYLSTFGKKQYPGKAETYVNGDMALRLKDVSFRYARQSPDILRNVCLDVLCGECLAVLGGNGAGKTTFLKVAAGLYRPYSGRVTLFGKDLYKHKSEKERNAVALLPQEVQAVFLCKTVREDLEDICRIMGYTGEKTKEKIGAVVGKLGIAGVTERHPYDLSGGEAERCALAKVLLTEPRLLLLDEPTKGLDPQAKATLSDILRELRQEGVSVILVTHDVEFAALCADRAAFFFDGGILPPATARSFFARNRFYTTAAARMANGIVDNAVTAEDIVLAEKGDKM